MSGCLQLRQEQPTAALPLNENLPASWTPLGDVLPINIDGDAATEYLLYFTYDGSNGPVGAVIYNTETEEDLPTDEVAAGRLSTSFIPYAILPSYRPGAGQGYIAEPSQRNAVQTVAVSFQTGLATTAAAVTDASDDALAILGGNNYLTWVWWQPARDRYGVTQLYAADHFETAALAPFNWESWRAAPTPIRDIVSVNPLHDRNQLCRRHRHLLVAPTEAPPLNGGLDEITYRDYDLGLSFCQGIPSLPFYPEGVVMAYLSSGDITLWDQQNLDEVTLTQLTEQVAQPEILRVNDLVGYKTIPGLETADSATLPRTAPAETSVCAEVVMPATFLENEGQAVTLYDLLPQATADEGSTMYTRRWLLFTLRHEPPHREPATTDRLYIKNVQVLPVPTTGNAVDCRARLEG